MISVLLSVLFLVLPPSWEYSGEIAGTYSIYSIVEAGDSSLIAAGAASSGSYRLWRSTNSGDSWVSIGPMTAQPFRCLLKASTDTLFAGRDDGYLYASDDHGATWSSLLDLDRAIRVLFETSANFLLAGTETDTAEIFRSLDGGNTWTDIDLPGSLDVLTLTECSSGRLVAGTNTATVYVSDDSGATWSGAGILGGAANCFSFAVYGDSLFAGTDNASGEVYRSDDFGNSFINLGNNLTYANVVYDILFSADTMYLGTGPTYGEAAKSTDFGTTIDYTRNLDGADAVYKIAPSAGGALYAATGNTYGDIFRSADLAFPGDSAPLSGASTVEALAFYGDSLFAGTDNASGEVYRSDDFGNSFINLGNNMPTANIVYDLLFYVNASDTAFFAATGPSGDVLMSEDFGISWVNTGDLVGASNAFSLMEKLLNPFLSHLYCGTGSSGDVFRTSDPLGISETGLLSAFPESTYIKISWSLAMEDNCLEYTILKKSLDEMTGYAELVRFEGSGSTPLPKTYSHKDRDVIAGNRYYYKLGVVDLHGNTSWYGPVSAVAPLFKPYLTVAPNPVKTTALIQYGIMKSSNIMIAVYDISGRNVRSLESGNSKTGHYTIHWDGLDDQGARLSSGVYFIRLSQQDLILTKKILLVN